MLVKRAVGGNLIGMVSDIVDNQSYVQKIRQIGSWVNPKPSAKQNILVVIVVSYEFCRKLRHKTRVCVCVVR